MSPHAMKGGGKELSLFITPLYSTKFPHENHLAISLLVVRRIRYLALLVHGIDRKNVRPPIHRNSGPHCSHEGATAYVQN